MADTWLDLLDDPWVKLHTADPGGAGTTAAAGDTTRKQATTGASSGGTKTMTGTAGPWTNAATTETLTHISLWSASTAGTFWRSLALTSSQAWVAGNTFTLTSLTLTVTPIAA
jgi:hypothetical protein